MNYDEIREDFNKRFDIEDQDDSIARFERFKNRVLIHQEELVRHGLMKHTVQAICLRLGEKNKPPHLLIQELQAEEDEKRFCYKVEVIFNIIVSLWPGSLYPANHNFSPSHPLNSFLDNLRNAVNDSNVDILVAEDLKIKFFPKGEKILDEKVKETMKCLDPASQKIFFDALEQRQRGKNREAVFLLHSCCEETLRYYFGKKSFKENHKALKSALQKQGISHVDVMNIAEAVNKVFDFYIAHCNKEVRHKPRDVSDAELEWLTYQTAVLLLFFTRVLDRPI